MYLNDKEEAIIKEFCKNLDEYDEKILKLLWQDGSVVVARFDTCFEDENDYDLDDEKYEEYWTFVFEVVEVSGNPPVYITEDNFFCVNYQNFPNEILYNDKKLN